MAGFPGWKVDHAVDLVGQAELKLLLQDVGVEAVSQIAHELAVLVLKVALVGTVILFNELFPRRKVGLLQQFLLQVLGASRAGSFTFNSAL